MKRWYSIRWKLPLSYAVVALLATLVLGAILLTILQGYYSRQERDFMLENARTASSLVSNTMRYTTESDILSRQLNSLAIFNGTRITLEDIDGNLLADTGNERDVRISIPDPTTWQAITANNDNIPGNLITIFEVAPRDDRRPPNRPNGPSIIEGIDGPPRVNGIPRRFDAPFMPDYSIELETINSGRLTELPTDSPFVFSASPSIGGGFNLHTVESTATITERSTQQVSVQVTDPNGRLLGTLNVSNGPAYGGDIVRSVTSAWIMAGGIAVLLAALIGWVASLHLSRPLAELTAITTRMAEGDLSARVNLDRKDELGTLATAYNHMSERIENTVDTLKRFVADAAHEIHTPLTALRTNLELLAERPNAESSQGALAQVQRLQALADNLLDLSRLEANDAIQNHAAVDLHALIYNISEIYASRAEQADLDFMLHMDEVPLINGDENQLTRMTANLLDNAIKFTPAGGTITVHLHQRNNQINLTVADTGIGIPTHEINHLFERFRRGRNTANYPGSGLGLAIVKAIVNAHDGTVSAKSSTTGTEFYVCLPCPP